MIGEGDACVALPFLDLHSYKKIMKQVTMTMPIYEFSYSVQSQKQASPMCLRGLLCARKRDTYRHYIHFIVPHRALYVQSEKEFYAFRIFRGAIPDPGLQSSNHPCLERGHAI